MSCPNCNRDHRGLPECALGVLLGVIEDRGEIARETVTPEVLTSVDVNEFWNRLGPVTVWLEESLLELGAGEVKTR